MNLTERLRGIVKPPQAGIGPSAPPAEVIEREGQGLPIPVGSASRRITPIEEALGGEWRDGCFIVEQRVDGDVLHGRLRVRDIAERLITSADHASLVARGAAARPPFMFFDLETTGLNGGAGTYAFLVGCGWFDEREGFATKQYLMARHTDERAMLEAIGRDLAKAGALVSFNGKSFDTPLIETRYLFHRLQWSAADLPHVDVLHPARRFWGDVSCSLVGLEADVLGVRRLRDVPGFEIPGRYFQFLRSGDARPLGAVLDHNRFDLLSLAGLMTRVVQLVARGPDAGADAREALALGRIYAQSGLDARARDAFTCALDLCERESHRVTVDLRVAAVHALALCERRARRYEEAARRWQALLTIPGCPPHLARQATEALAIHHEHRLRDLSGARTFALCSLDDGSTPAWRAAVDRRVTRISRKMERAGLLLET